MISMSGYTVMTIVDRVCLAAYSENTLAASGAAVLISMVIVNFFAGFVFSCQPRLAASLSENDEGGAFSREIVNTLVLSVACVLLLVAICPILVLLSQFSGRAPEVVRLESIYISWSGAFGPVITFNTALTCVFTVLGKTRTVLAINTIGQAATIILTYCLVFGAWGFPELGMAGSAVSLLVGSLLILASYCVWLPSKVWQGATAAARSILLPRDAVRARIADGFAVGANDGADEVGNTAIIWAIGLLGPASLAANNFNIILNYISIIPIFGLGNGANALVAKAMADGDLRKVRGIVLATIMIGAVYCSGVTAALFFFGRCVTEVVGIGKYSLPILEHSIAVTHVIWLFALAFLLSFIGARTLQALSQNSYVLKVRLWVMWGVSVPVAFVIATTSPADVNTLPWMWVALSSFELIIGIIYMIKIFSVERTSSIQVKAAGLTIQTKLQN
ncbi:MATE family efflux transporter [Mesorhizobium sp. MSK_1335]|uniref:MATE family efflux transporter n=2 Tax=Mesorhizobium montanum TaxID=3072323 RepID=A0ABU4ZKL5_9HYPH|nr:MATE family efflux transporter [Mesorhizobium sp. MSK_1335]